jgi:putative ATP-dependent endonuclease of OLD family
LFLEQVIVENFRLFKTLDLTLNPGLNVLVGENDSGKTALIDGIRLTLGTNSAERAFVKESDFHGNETSLSIRLKFSDLDRHAHRFVEHLSHEDYVEDGVTKKRSVLFIQLTAEKTGIERRGYPYIKTAVRSGVDGNGLSIETEIRDFLATTYLKPLRDAEAELSSGKASRLSQILNSSREIRDGAIEILKIIAEANEQLLRDEGALKKSADNIQSNYLHQLIFEVDKEELGAYVDIAGVKKEGLEELPATAKRRHLRAILEGLSLALTQDRKLHGLGYHNLLFMAAELLLLEQEVDKEFPLLLVEEPEAHLHPQLQMKLLQFINSKVKSTANSEGIQCILSTHSPNLSSKADPSEIIMLGKGNVWPLRPKETELDTEDYSYLRKFLDATKANVFFAKGLLFVEGDAENILLPEIARLLGRPLENYGVSIVKYDNSGSWKRFARLFLRNGKDGETDAWCATKVCVLRDLDLWPDCAETTENGANRYGFKELSSGNQSYWRRNCADESAWRENLIDGLSRQNVFVKIADDWTFEYCLAKYGLFDESYEAINGSRAGIDDITGTDEEKATYIQSKVSKTDFAYRLAMILEKQLMVRIETAIAALVPEQKDSPNIGQEVSSSERIVFAKELKGRLPPYIVEAIEYLTQPVSEGVESVEGTGDAEPA